MAATRTAITDVARQLTANHGLSGFTIEQVCEQVGVSRRTFFNYFPSKEDAIIGRVLDEFPPDAIDEFIAKGHSDSIQRIPGTSLTTTLLDDLVTLTAALAAKVNFTPDHMQQLMKAIKVEPQLMIKMIGTAEDREQEFAHLIARREGLEPNDPEAMFVAKVFGMLSRLASQTFFSPSNTASYPELLEQRISQADRLFTQSTLTKEGTR